MRPRLARAWPAVRAALVTFHLLAIGLAAVPAPVEGMSRKVWAEPAVQIEFAAWGRLLGVAPKVLEERVWELANLWLGLRRKFMAPVRPYLKVSGAHQPWRMFAAPNRFPSTYQVQWRARTGEWQTLFEERSEQHVWRRGFFEQERVRSVLARYSWPNKRKQALRLCEYLAREVFVEVPEAARVRCRYWNAPVPSPEEARLRTPLPGTWIQEHTVRRP